MTITVDQILQGVGLGRMQFVGHMGIVPLVDEEGNQQDEVFAPPDVEVSNRMYGSVDIHNTQGRPTIVPTGAGWISKEQAQDHAIAGCLIVQKASTARVDTAMCIESSQGGYLRRGAHEMIVLPAALRAAAMAMRSTSNYGKLWASIGQMSAAYGVTNTHRQHMTDLLARFQKELDEFVAQFELVPMQVGAIVLIGNRIVGIERAPNEAYWARVWTPLIRVCYGTLAVRARQVLGDAKPKYRVPLKPRTRSLEGISAALAAAPEKSRKLLQKEVDKISGCELQAADKAEQKFLDYDEAEQKYLDYEVLTLASRHIAGQVVRRGQCIAYASLCCPYDPKHRSV